MEPTIRGRITAEDLRIVRTQMAGDIPFGDLACRAGLTTQMWLEMEGGEDLIPAEIFENIMRAIDRYDRDQLN